MTNGEITSGGGFSLYDARPYWQSSHVSNYFTTVAAQGKSPIAGYAAANRGFPDISLIGTNYRTVIGGYVRHFGFFTCICWDDFLDQLSFDSSRKNNYGILKSLLVLILGFIRSGYLLCLSLQIHSTMSILYD
jgi:hypothetical protein